jgi:chromosome segregation ATPase
LDNSDQRVAVGGPNNNNLISVKKTYNVDTDKDSYYLNGAHIQEKELFNLFEAAGFSLQGQS